MDKILRRKQSNLGPAQEPHHRPGEGQGGNAFIVAKVHKESPIGPIFAFTGFLSAHRFSYRLVRFVL